MAKRGKLSKDFEAVDKVVRPERVRHYAYLILIVCEDQVTEKVYFEAFKDKIPRETIFLTAVGTGLDPLGVVQHAKLKRDELAKMCKREVDSVWVVFDKDDADKEAGKIARFETALSEVADNKFNLAYSNEVLELWLLLHLMEVDPAKALPRQEIYQLLQDHIAAQEGHGNFVYEHGNSNILEKIRTLGDEQKAIERAETLMQYHKEKHLLACNPKTLVHLLVNDLHGWIRYYSYQ